MKVVSIDTHKESRINGVTVSNDYLRAVEKQYAKEIAKELQKGYMKLLSTFNG